MCRVQNAFQICLSKFKLPFKINFYAATLRRRRRSADPRRSAYEIGTRDKTAMVGEEGSAAAAVAAGLEEAGREAEAVKGAGATEGGEQSEISIDKDVCVICIGSCIESFLSAWRKSV